MWSTRLFRVWLAGRCRLKISCSRCSGLVKNLVQSRRRVLRNDARNLHMDGNNQALLQLPSTLATAVTSYGSSWGAERPRHLNFDDYGFSGLYRLYPSPAQTLQIWDGGAFSAAISAFCRVCAACICCIHDANLRLLKTLRAAWASGV